ncbi:MAG: dockerin type I repeat-containing protein [Ruminococcus sp.]|nr:dockerin type I repeat-containing protein [Ruminococcus sp.]
MKRLLSFVLVFAMIISVAVIPAFSFSDDSVRYYRKNFTDKYVKPYDAADGYYFYYEQYHHYIDENDPDSEIDWVLVYAGDMSYEQGKVKQVVGRRIFFADESSSPFVFKYAVYDVEKNEFYPISDELFEKYDGLYDAFHREEAGVAGIKIGDADFDKKLTVIDATVIQRAIAKISDFNEKDDLSEYQDCGGGLNYVSDFDRDGERTVLDATRIQRYLAQNPNEEPTEDDDMMM